MAARRGGMSDVSLAGVRTPVFFFFFADKKKKKNREEKECGRERESGMERGWIAQGRRHQQHNSAHEPGIDSCLCH